MERSSNLDVDSQDLHAMNGTSVKIGSDGAENGSVEAETTAELINNVGNVLNVVEVAAYCKQ